MVVHNLSHAGTMAVHLRAIVGCLELEIVDAPGGETREQCQAVLAKVEPAHSLVVASGSCDWMSVLRVDMRTFEACSGLVVQHCHWRVGPEGRSHAPGEVA